MVTSLANQAKYGAILLSYFCLLLNDNRNDHESNNKACGFNLDKVVAGIRELIEGDGFHSKITFVLFVEKKERIKRKVNCLGRIAI